MPRAAGQDIDAWVVGFKGPSAFAFVGVVLLSPGACSSESGEGSRIPHGGSAGSGGSGGGAGGGISIDGGAASGGGGSGASGGISGSGGSTPASGGSGGGTSSRCRQDGPCQLARCTDPFARECDWSCLPFFVCDEIFVRFNAKSPDSLEGPYTLATPSAARCALEALRDGESGSFVLIINTDQPVTSQREVLIFSNRNVLTQEATTTNGVVEEALVGPYPLHPPAYFEGCLARTDPTELFACLTNLGASCEN